MPVMPGYPYADTPHPLTKAGKLYGCHNHGAYATETQVHDGWTADGRRAMRAIPVAEYTGCKHDQRATDSRCVGCAWL